MDHYSLIVVTDETSPIRRFDLRRTWVRRAAWAGGFVAFLLVAGLVDYVRLRIDQLELNSLRTETSEQREKIAEFESTLEGVEQNLERLSEFERKVRIIANLPGSSGAGGEDVAEVAQPDQRAAGSAPASSSGIGETGPAPAPPTGKESAHEVEAAPTDASAAPDDRVGMLRRDAERLGIVADARKLSLSELLERLEGKRRHLASTPAIWPTRGWLTSRFGYRTSPFTGRRQFHSGLDIAGEAGTDVVAPARGVVSFVGKRGPLGNTLIVDHGYGIRTHYGHAREIYVKRGEEVERGQVLAALGNSGRSTGPHLHYSVEVNGKARNPLDYIFD